MNGNTNTNTTVDKKTQLLSGVAQDQIARWVMAMTSNTSSSTMAKSLRGRQGTREHNEDNTAVQVHASLVITPVHDDIYMWGPAHDGFYCRLPYRVRRQGGCTKCGQWNQEERPGKIRQTPPRLPTGYSKSQAVTSRSDVPSVMGHTTLHAPVANKPPNIPIFAIGGFDAGLIAKHRASEDYISMCLFT